MNMSVFRRGKHPRRALLLLSLVLIALVALVGGAIMRTHATKAATTITYSPPLTISQGGTYSGNWQSTDPNTPAVTITTSDPVTIINSNLRGPGDLIAATNSVGHDITVQNTSGVGLNPNVSGRPNGSFLNVENVSHVDVEHCYMESVEYGVFLHNYVPKSGITNAVTIRYNQGKNMNGNHSNGSGGYTSDHTASHFVILYHLLQVPGVDISWNQAIDEPYNSAVDDVINVYQSNSSSSDPINIHDNYVQGAYATNPKTDGYSGGGIITDGGNDTMAEATAYVHIYNNQVVSTTNYGIAFANGHDNVASNNRVISSGLLPDGSDIAAQNVGMYIADIYGVNIANGTMYNDHMHDNVVGWVNKKDANQRNDMYLQISTEDYGNNSYLPNPITLSTEAAEFTAWQNKLSSAGVHVGPPNTQGFSTSFESGQPQPSWTNTVDSGPYPAGGINNVGGICCGLSGPETGTRNEITHSGSTALMYSGYDNSSSSSYAYDEVFDLSSQNLVVGSSTTLTYWIYPESSSNSLAGNYVSGNNSTCVAIDLIFSDGSNLRDSGAVDQHGNRAHPAYQCGHLTLDQWNQVTVNLGNNNNGKTIVRLDVGYDQPANTGGYRGYIDDISISN